jgi:hypothetical protein
MQQSEDGVVLLCTSRYCRKVFFKQGHVKPGIACFVTHGYNLASKREENGKVHKSVLPFSHRSFAVGHHSWSYLCWLLIQFVDELFVHH